MTHLLHRLLAIVVLAAFLAGVQASVSVIVPDFLVADEPQQIRINPRIEDRPDLQKKFNAYRVYLATEPPGWGIGVVCWLSYEEDINTRYVNVTIPADMAPEDSKLYISAGLMKKGAARVNGFTYSIGVKFKGGNGTWARSDTNGRAIGSQDQLSCQAYGCARDCSEKYYGDTSREWEADKCIQQCANDLNPRGQAAAGVVPVTSALIVSIAIVLAHIL